MRPLVWVTLLVLTAQATAAQEANLESEGEVVAGSTGNVLPIVFVNDSAKPVHGVGVRVSAAHAALANGRVEPARIESIGVGESGTFSYVFDVDSETEGGSSANVWFAFSAESGQLSADSAQMRLRITRSPSAADAANPTRDPSGSEEVTSTTGASGMDVLYLARIERDSRGVGDSSELQGAGAGYLREDRYDCETPLRCFANESNVGFTSFPQTIELGQSFEIAATSRRRGEAIAFCPVSPGARSTLQVVYWAVSRRGHLYAGSNVESMAGPACRGEGGLPIVDWEVGVETRATIRCRPTQATPNRELTFPRYQYLCRSEGTGEATRDAQNAEVEVMIPWTTDEPFKLTAYDSISRAPIVSLVYARQGPAIEAAFTPSFELVQRLETRDESAPRQADPDTEGETQIDRTAATGAVGVGTTRPRPGTGAEPLADRIASVQPAGDAPAGTASDSGSGNGSSGASGGAAGPGISGTDPSQPTGARDPRIAALIREWLAIAEPPANVTQGARFQYNEWGQLSGTSADGGRATPSFRPDAAVGATPVEHVWSRRAELDSVDHCTVGEFVEARLAGAGIESCASRHRPRVPDITGMPVAAARDLLAAFWLEPEFRAGRPAASAELEGTVERQGTPGATLVDRGSVVAVWVHSRLVDKRVLADLRGLPIADAKRQLEIESFEVTVSLGDEAPDQRTSGTVQAQSPAPGSEVLARSSVELVVYRNAVRRVVVSDWVGEPIAEAEAALRASGLDVVRIEGSPARLVSEIGMVAAQSPQPGSEVLFGGTVTLTTFGDNRIALPDLEGTAVDAAMRELESRGLVAGLVSGDAAPDARRANTVARQAPAAGTLVEPGTLVTITAYTGFVELVTVPSVVGQTLGEARSTLSRAGLVVRALGPLNASADSFVVVQSPRASAAVEPGSTVTLTITPPTSTPGSPSPAERAEAISRLTSPTFQPGRTTTGTSGAPAPGSESPVEPPRHGGPLTAIDCRVPGYRAKDTHWRHIAERGPFRSGQCGYFTDSAKPIYVSIEWAVAAVPAVVADYFLPVACGRSDVREATVLMVPEPYFDPMRVNFTTAIVAGGGGQGKAAYISASGPFKEPGLFSDRATKPPASWFTPIAQHLLEQVRPHAIACNGG